ncbi:TPA: hypothetical protein OE716_003360 [Escherichia coli]|nr:hypothetical protein [Escherichia coli]
MTHQQVQFEKPAQASSKAMVGKDREAVFKKVWQATHRDYRGRLADGSLSVMGYAKFGGGLVTAVSISDDELAERLEEAQRRAR